ncbi:hypothetical protein RIF29_29964 [Crotalaria pallida]|uniref:Uncharacterized protein n=1 Tax=Crotalaria pallida TaxID=3830 RepID=A0AAN9EFZ6_CROPI
MDSNSKFPLSASLSPLPPLLSIRAPLTLHDYSDSDSYSYFEGEGSSPSPSEEDEGSPPPPTLRVMLVAHLSTLRFVAPYNMYFNRDKTVQSRHHVNTSPIIATVTNFTSHDAYVMLGCLCLTRYMVRIDKNEVEDDTHVAEETVMVDDVANINTTSDDIEATNRTLERSEAKVKSSCRNFEEVKIEELNEGMLKLTDAIYEDAQNLNAGLEREKVEIERQQVRTTHNEEQQEVPKQVITNIGPSPSEVMDESKMEAEETEFEEEKRQGI